MRSRPRLTRAAIWAAERSARAVSRAACVATRSIRRLRLASVAGHGVGPDRAGRAWRVRPDTPIRAAARVGGSCDRLYASEPVRTTAPVADSIHRPAYRASAASTYTSNAGRSSMRWISALVPANAPRRARPVGNTDGWTSTPVDWASTSRVFGTRDREDAPGIGDQHHGAERGGGRLDQLREPVLLLVQLGSDQPLVRPKAEHGDGFALGCEWRPLARSRPRPARERVGNSGLVPCEPGRPRGAVRPSARSTAGNPAAFVRRLISAGRSGPLTTAW